mgnify:CR=1 FL=1
MKNFKIILIIAVAFIGGMWASSLLHNGKTSRVEKMESGKNDHQDEHGHASHDETAKEEKDEHAHGKEAGKKDSHKEHADHDGHSDHDDHAEEEEGHEEGVIKLSKDSQELGKFKVKEAESAPLTNKIPVTGRIAQDVENVTYVFPSGDGKIEKCFAHLGSVVKNDEILCVMKNENSEELTEIKSPSAGVIIAEFINAGEHVDEATSIYTVADVTKLWANFDVYEKDIGSVSLGQKILIYPVSYPNKKFEGEIVFISPRVDESTYTVKIKVLVENTDLLLKLGMFVRGEIVVKDEENYVIVPSEALQSVEGKTVVFVKSGPESFEVREVSVKLANKEQAAILSGIKEGEMVVTQGSFILKSKLLESEMEHAHSH